jgi:hypothetical protein
MHWMLKRYLAEETGGEGSSSAGGISSTESVDVGGETAGEESINWGGMSDELDQDEEADWNEGGESVVEDKTPPAAETPATNQPAAAPTPTPTEAPAPAVAPVEPQPVAETPSVAPTEYAAWKEQRMTELEKVYALDEASANAMLTEPEVVLPKLAARMHMEVLENSMRAMQQMMPVMMQQVQQYTENESRARNLFTGINPDLAYPRLEPAIVQFGQVYRKVNPTASAEDASRAIGNLVRAALGIAAPSQGMQQSTPQMQQAPTPFTPARGAGGGRAPVSSGNPFEQLASEFLADEY